MTDEDNNLVIYDPTTDSLSMTSIDLGEVNEESYDSWAIPGMPEDFRIYKDASGKLIIEGVETEQHYTANGEVIGDQIDKDKGFYDSIGRQVLSKKEYAKEIADCNENTRCIENVDDDYTTLDGVIGEVSKDKHAVRRAIYKTFDAMGMMKDYADGFSNIFSLFNGGSTDDETYMSKFKQDMFKYFSIDNYIQTELCELDTDKSSVTTAAFFPDGVIGAHIEGWKTVYNNKLPCGVDSAKCAAEFNSEYSCKNNFCVDKAGELAIYNRNIYEVSYYFSPEERVMLEDKTLEIKVKLKGSGVDEIIETFKLSSGQGGKTNKLIKVFNTNKNFDQACLKFSDSGVFKNEFITLLETIDSKDEMCNSLITKDNGIDSHESNLGVMSLGLSSVFYSGSVQGSVIE